MISDLAMTLLEQQLDLLERTSQLGSDDYRYSRLVVAGAVSALRTIIANETTYLSPRETDFRKLDTLLVGGDGVEVEVILRWTDAAEDEQEVNGTSDSCLADAVGDVLWFHSELQRQGNGIPAEAVPA